MPAPTGLFGKGEKRQRVNLSGAAPVLAGSSKKARSAKYRTLQKSNKNFSRREGGRSALT